MKVVPVGETMTGLPNSGEPSTIVGPSRCPTSTVPTRRLTLVIAPAGV